MPPRQRVYDRAVLIGYDAVSGIEWDRCLRNGLSVGICPRCQHPLKPGQPEEIGRTVWYPATCRSTSCTYETTAHGPRQHLQHGEVGAVTLVFAGDNTNAADVNAIGVVARAVRTTAKSGITSEAGYLRLDDIPVLGGYVYRIITSCLTLDSTVDGEVGAARIRVAQNAAPGTPATTASTQIGMMRDYQDANAQAALTPLVTDYFAPSNGYLSVLLTGQRVTALGTFQIFASATEPCHLIVECTGKDPGDTGVSL